VRERALVFKRDCPSCAAIGVKWLLRLAFRRSFFLKTRASAGRFTLFGFSEFADARGRVIVTSRTVDFLLLEKFGDVPDVDLFSSSPLLFFSISFINICRSSSALLRRGDGSFIKIPLLSRRFNPRVYHP